MIANLSIAQAQQSTVKLFNNNNNFRFLPLPTAKLSVDRSCKCLLNCKRYSSPPAVFRLLRELRQQQI